MAKACGKIILSGEHGVVYGYPAIAQCIDRSVFVKVIPRGEPGLYFEPPNVKLRTLNSELFKQIAPKLVELFGPEISHLCFQVQSDIPPGSGLGSSAALSVALVRAIFEHNHEVLSQSDTVQYALELEKIFHGNPSGVDHTTIAAQSLIWFHQGRFENIRCLNPLHFRISTTATQAGTRALITAVRRNFEKNPRHIQTLFENIACITFQMRDAIESNDRSAVGALMTKNHFLLQDLGVSTPELDRLCESAKQEGALGAKLTGAGGGGSVIALF
ncbi:MAG: mevalonate kinase [Myxococcaceae bacterium]|nr:mevalonate kinase [Myxococcaceae bacterium]MBH2006896.1 mevalonate kinase [Myxococcaceae bacterium]